MLKLNLGCGKNIREDYYNIDVRWLSNIDIVADVRQLPFEKGTIDKILASDIYEHVSYTESLDLLQHWSDLLKSNGMLILRAPCLDTLIQHFLNSTSLEHIQTGIEFLYGAQDYKENFHSTICHSVLMKQHLESVGMKGITYTLENANIIFKAYKK